MELLTVPGGVIASWRAGSGPPALLLHGGPGLSDYTAGLAEELSPMFDIVRYQQRGLPPTTVDQPFTVESHVSDTVSVLDALQIERAWVIGHSWGGHLAMHLAVSHPKRLLGVIVLSPLGATGDGGEAEMGARMSARIPASVRQQAEELDQRAMRGEGTEADALESLRLYWPAYFAHPEAAPPMPSLKLSVRCYGETFESIREHLRKKTLEQELPSYRGVAVFIHAREDPIPYRYTADSARLIPGATFSALDDCGHFPWMEKPGLIAYTLRQLRRF
ncbi:MAG: alpha/beta hydrolase [Candidatus Dormibacteraeota bacterium]|nr:alpha/beta hydrolase [Candidatus Dormibacteraeota bacterium]